jgi:hypothetical protein
VSEVGDNIHAERALGALDEETMLAEHREDDVEVTQVVHQEALYIKILSKKTSTNRRR